MFVNGCVAARDGRVLALVRRRSGPIAYHMSSEDCYGLGSGVGRGRTDG